MKGPSSNSKENSVTQKPMIHSILFRYDSSEPWSLTQSRRKIKAFDMICYRRILKVSPGQRTNQSILKPTTTYRAVATITAHDNKRQTEFTVLWTCRVKRNWLERILVQGRIDGKKCRGCPPMRFFDNIKRITRLSSPRQNWSIIKHIDNREK